MFRFVGVLFRERLCDILLTVIGYYSITIYKSEIKLVIVSVAQQNRNK